MTNSFSARSLIAALAFGCLTGVSSPAAPRLGYGIVARMSGTAEYIYPETTAHQYPTGRQEIKEGLALTEGQTIVTGADWRLCMVLTPGAVLCIGPNTIVKLVKLEQATEGLPESEKDLNRRIELAIAKGAIFVHAGVPSPTMYIRVATPAGNVEATGGDFIVQQDKEDKDAWRIAADKYGVSFLVADKQELIPQGKVLRAAADKPGGNITAAMESASAESLSSRFDMCQCFFKDLDPMVFQPQGADMNKLADWMGGIEKGISQSGDPGVWHDVSPSFRIPSSKVSMARTPMAKSAPSVRMKREDAWEWYRNVGVIRGVNYVSRKAVNSTDMWQKSTFDSDAIDQELGWAQRVGYNSVRVQLQFLVWKENPKEFKDRFRTFLAIAAKHQIGVVPVLFDDAMDSGKDPYLGPQEAVQGVANSGWTPSPGPERVSDRNAWPDLERYVRDLIRSFRHDRRIQMWDMYNTPGNANMREKTLPLLDAAFRWAHQEKHTQPLTAGSWVGSGGPMSARIMELSDIITVQSFRDAAGVAADIKAAKLHARPIICTDWLKRQTGNTFGDILPVFAKERVGWFSRGLAKGRAQWYLPDGSKAGDPDPRVWQQDVLHEDGKPYDEKEVELIRAFRFTE